MDIAVYYRATGQRHTFCRVHLPAIAESSNTQIFPEPRDDERGWDVRWSGMRVSLTNVVFVLFVIVLYFMY